jgi:hypothetical protein
LRDDLLQRDATVDPARRKRVEERQGEQDPPGERRKPPPQLSASTRGPSADDMVPGVDRLEERVEMRGRPRLEGRRDQDDQLRTARQAFLQGLIPAPRIGPDDESLGLPLPGFEEVEQALADHVGVGPFALPASRHDDHEDIAVGDRVAFRGGVERVDPVVFRRRTLRAGEDPHA